jgi:hypothetical protein
MLVTNFNGAVRELGGVTRFYGMRLRLAPSGRRRNPVLRLVESRPWSAQSSEREDAIEYSRLWLAVLQVEGLVQQLQGPFH